MIRFRQKEFFWPTALMVGTTGLSMAQAHSQGKDAEKQAEAQREQMERQNELIQKQNRQLENLAKKNPSAGPQAAEVMRERTYAIPARLGSIMSTEAGKMAKDIGKFAWNHKNGLAKTTAWGAGTALAGYGANKIIQGDMKREGLEVTSDGALVPKEKKMSLTPPIPAAVKAWAKKNPKMVNGLRLGGSAVGMGVGFEGVPKVLGYMADKQQAKDQIAATQKAKSFSVLSSIAGAQIWKTPGKTLLGGAIQGSSFGMFGRHDVAKFADYLRKNGTSSWSKKLGNAMLAKTPDGSVVANKKALVGAIGAGSVLTKATYDAAQKGIEKATRTIDPKAYKYQDSKNQQVTE